MLTDSRRSPVPQYFTPEQANEALAEVRPLTERMVAHRRALLEAQAKQEEIAARVSGNGSGVQPKTLGALELTIAEEAAGIAECIAQIQALGAQIKDLDEGLVDFPARQAGEEVLLCWRLGEERVEFWHGIDEGFAGRRPL